MESRSGKAKGNPFTLPAAVLTPATPGPHPWDQAQQFRQEIEDHLRLVPEDAREREGPLRLLVVRLPAILESLGRVHEEQVRQVGERTANLSAANAGLKKQITDSAR